MLALLSLPLHPAQAQDHDEAARIAARVHLARNQDKPGVVTLPSGLQYEILRDGDGARPGPDNQVMVDYQGRFTDGSEFDSSYARGRPAIFEVAGVIAGWTEALQLMQKGAKWRLTIPPELGYGAEGDESIPPFAVLVFEMELLDILPALPLNPAIDAVIADPIPGHGCGAAPAPGHAPSATLHAAGNRWQDCMAGYLRDTFQEIGGRIAQIRALNPETMPAAQRRRAHQFFQAALEKFYQDEDEYSTFPGIAGVQAKRAK